MVLAYLIVHLTLLAISPILGRFALNFVYPEVKTYVRAKKAIYYISFGILGYFIAAALAVSESIMPIYSVEEVPVFGNYGTSSLFLIVSFLIIVFVDTSIVEYLVSRRKRRIVVGVPKKIIRYGINKEIVKGKQEKRERDIERITNELQQVLGKQKELQPILRSIRSSVIKEHEIDQESLHALLHERDIGHYADIEGEGRGIVTEFAKKIKKKREEGGGREYLQEETKKRRQREENLKQLRQMLSNKKASEGRGVSEKTNIKNEREKLIEELEKKIAQTQKDPEKKEKTQLLLTQLKEKIEEDTNVETYDERDIEEITRALKAMDEKAPEDHKEETPERRHVAVPEVEIGESLVGYQHAYPKRKEDDILKAVVGDVRQQLGDGEEKEEKFYDRSGDSRWYDKKALTKPKGDEFQIPSEGKVELFEDDLAFGEGGDLDADFGDMGDDLGSFDEFSDLEGMDQDLASSDFDGMFVDVGKENEGCPNCGKKGTSLVYCSSCGKPMCSNCAESVEGSDDFIKYKCPHCKVEFAMKRRA